MRLYNVTFDLSNTNNILTPTVPESAGDGENKEIKRICLTDSIEHCFQAIASCNREVRKGAKFVIKEVDVEENDRLITPDFLFNEDYVPDALENNEYWYLDTLKANVLIGEIEFFEYDFVLAYSCIPKEKCLEIISKYTSIEDLKDCRDSKEIHEKFNHWANTQKEYDMMDNVFEDLAMLPWAQKTKIYNLKYKVLERKIEHDYNER